MLMSRQPRRLLAGAARLCRRLYRT